MNNKRTLIGMVVITALMLGWQAFLAHEYNTHNWRRPGETDATTQPIDTGSASIASATTQGSTTLPSGVAGPGASATQPSLLAVAGWRAATLAPAAGSTTIGAIQFNDKTYHVGMQVSSTGAGLDWVALNQYRQEVDSADIYRFQHAYDDQPDNTRPLATRGATIDGTRIDLSNVEWSTGDQSDRAANYFVDLAYGGVPAVRINKTFEVGLAQSEPTSPQGYEVTVTYTVRNLSPQSHTVELEFNGPTVPHAETSRQDTEIVAGYDDVDYVKIDNKDVSSFSEKAPSRDYVVNDQKLPLVWLGASSNYFNAIVRPDRAQLLSKAFVNAINPTADAAHRLVGIQLTTAPMVVAAGDSASLPLHVFFGPKKRELLTSKYYASFPLRYDDTLILITGNFICGLCTIPWLINLLVMFLAGLHFLLRDWGLAIIALVCGVRLILHPITKRSQVSMMKMQKLAPELERLKQKFGDDKEGFAKAQMDLYKSVGFTPVLGCLPMFLQMPIFIALWRALQTTFELRQAPFLSIGGHHLTWIHDLSQPDFLIKFANTYSLPFGLTIAGLNILPLAMAVVTFINQKYFTPKPAAMTPEQEQQQKMMTYMTLIFPIMFYSLPSGLNLYYLTSTSLGILESKRIRDHIKEREEIEKRNAPELIDMGGKRPRAQRVIAKPVEPDKKGGLGAWVAKMQTRMDEIARQAEQNRKRKT